jgi:hypothetical protein
MQTNEFKSKNIDPLFIIENADGFYQDGESGYMAWHLPLLILYLGGVDFFKYKLTMPAD